MSTMKNLQSTIRAWAISKQWRGPDAETQRTTGDDIALIHSEVSEALEAYRLCADPLAYWETFTVEYLHPKWKNSTLPPLKFKNLTSHQVIALTGESPEQLGLVGKPEGVGPELADTLIRIFDYAEHVGLDMDFEVERKMAHNETREIRHGGSHL